MEEKRSAEQKGDDKAFQELIEEEKQALSNGLYICKNEDDALDIVQDTIYKAFISIKN